MNVLDLFSGIGGFCRGLEQAGMRTVAFCEIDPFCHAVLHKHWPDVPIHADIRRLDGNRYRGTVELVCGGYPCQPFSVAGSRRGAEDERHLWPEMYRLIREIRPRWVVAENVGGHINFGFDAVAASLEAENYTVWPFVIPASAVNAPHRRDRLWIVAHANGANEGKAGNCHSTGIEGRASLQTSRQGREKGGRHRKAVFHHRLFALSELAPYADRQRLQRRDRQLQEDQERQHRVSAILSALSPAPFLGDELPTPILCGKNDGVPHRAHRLRALGNSIVPQIAEIIGRVIVDFEQHPQ